jgi:CRISPR/Cas system CSM-associated protein Csm2 small subunit
MKLETGKKKRLDLESDEEEEKQSTKNDSKNSLKINENYAKRYENWRLKEELQKCNNLNNYQLNHFYNYIKKKTFISQRQRR